MTSSNQKNQRYERALTRNLNELLRSLSYRNAYNTLYAVAPTDDLSFFSYASLALFDGMISHAIKVLDRHPDAAAFFYLFNCNPTTIARELAKNRLPKEDIDRLADKLIVIRNKTHFHIDKQGVLSPSKVWKQADISGSFFNRTLDRLWIVMNTLHVLQFERDFGQSLYTAGDIKPIVEAAQSKGIVI